MITNHGQINHGDDDDNEQVAFADWINDMFSKDTVSWLWSLWLVCLIILMIMIKLMIMIWLFEKDVNHKLPLKKDGSDMYEKMDDGILLCKVTMRMIWMRRRSLTILPGAFVFSTNHKSQITKENFPPPQIINLAAPDTIDERAINKGKEVQIFRQHENLTLARNSAR